MELYLSGSITNDEWNQLEEQGILFLLQTFYEMKSWKEEKIKRALNCCDTFMLDSGAFTFMNSGKKVHWKTYVNEYIEFINKYDIQYFIELDLYGVLGVETTEKIRRYIEHHTGKKPIPVYHGTMPVSYYRMLCENYPYVAISATGTIESSRWTQNKKALKQIIRIGHSYGTKLHGLGYTRLENINRPEVLFDSVDSTAWLSGARFGTWYYMKHGILKQKSMAGRNLSRKDFNDNNLKIWIDKQKDLYYNH